jgi:rSAM/selenodomain-associated transferase 1
MNDNALAIMAKKPIIGETKTRLCPPLTPSQATVLYEALLADTIALCQNLEEIDLTIAITPLDSKEYFQGITPTNTTLIPVECEDIGECLAKTFAQLFTAGYNKVCALNSDGPTLPHEYISQAFDLLDQYDLVFGPGDDGGYYLVGLKEQQLELFRGIEWSTPRVLTQSLDKAESLNLSVATLPTWYDIDTAADIIRLRRELFELPSDKLANTRRCLRRLPLDE